MPEPQPGTDRPADGSTPGTEPDRDPAVADESIPPPVPPDADTRPARTVEPTAVEPVPAVDGPGADEPQPVDATGPVPAPRWSGSAPVPPPPPRKRGWGESAEPTPLPPPRPEEPPEHRTPVDPWAGADTGGWDLPSAELPPLPPTLPYPAPPQTRPWSGPPAVGAQPAPPVGPYPVSPPPAARSTAPAARPTTQVRPTAPPKPPKPPKQRRGRRSAAPSPVAPPPGWEAPRGYVPVPVRRRRRWPWLLLLTLACCCGCPAYYGMPISAQYPARAALPEQVQDLRLRQDGGSTEAARELENEVRQAHWLAEDTFAGVYTTSDGKPVTVFGGTGFRLNPEADAEAEITRLTERYGLDASETVDTGVRGRHERCAVGGTSGTDVVVCTSVDHGSIATGVFTRLSVADSAALLATLRGQIVQPERS
ncbi:hypothetical protein ACFOW4_18120 [Micromonospora sp. GCM10011542]|uniref:hypothetical protein n=1 Tax=Micromonospora sp. GCM10011542 TaxID=3317337 RepID=UPI0036200F65